MPSSALPLNLPADFASITLAVTFAPRRITPRPSTMIGSASEAATRRSGWLSFELTDWSMVTLKVVPAGMTIGGASCCGAGCAAEADELVGPSATLPELPPFCEERHPHKPTNVNAQIQAESLAKRMYFPPITFGVVLKPYQGDAVGCSAISISGA